MIGVLTWKLHNFGTALQAYALVTAVEEISGKECKLLNYNLPGSDCIEKVCTLTLNDYRNRIKNRCIVWRKSYKNRKIQEKFSEQIDEQHIKFNEFYGKIPHDNQRVSVTKKQYFDNTYEKIIVGSDQVWNPKYFCETYFLNFVSDEKKYSYAPSIGCDYLKEEQSTYLKEKLEGHFQRISVREKTGKKLLEEILPNEIIESVLDPTLLFDGEWWTSKLSLVEKKNIDEYILVYTLSDNMWYKEAILNIQKSLNIQKIIYITPEDNLYFYKEVDNIVINAGPTEFLDLIKNAEYIITDSFHGVCFSLNFEKTFWCLERFGNKNYQRNENSRIKDLLFELDLNDRFCQKGSNIKRGRLDYNDVNLKLLELRKKSKMYLYNIIQN